MTLLVLDQVCGSKITRYKDTIFTSHDNYFIYKSLVLAYVEVFNNVLINFGLYTEGDEVLIGSMQGISVYQIHVLLVIPECIPHTNYIYTIVTRIYCYKA